ncbi:MAG TPA: hypothetical protein VFK81_16040 [Terriglobales bacterium]|nr:hypothetical protein [Terriglobales bacterium]
MALPANAPGVQSHFAEPKETHRMPTRISLAATIAIFLALAGTLPAVGAAAPNDACSLLTQAQVSTAVGATVGTGTHVTPSYLKTCTWSVPGAPTKGVKSVTLSLQPGNSFASAKMFMEQAKAMAKSEKGAAQFSNASVSGIGDDAFYTSMGAGYTGLLVKKGDVVFKVAMYGDLPTEKKKAIEKTLALQALSKL